MKKCVKTISANNYVSVDTFVSKYYFYTKNSAVHTRISQLYLIFLEARQTLTYFCVTS